jgi:teichuronic acid biosynthesis glycosyltransferase TuaG
VRFSGIFVDVIFMKPIFYNEHKIEERIISTDVGRNVCEKPIVSIVIPAYNVSDFIAETLDSALAQTFREFEIIVINDGSPDSQKLENVLSDYLSYIIYVKQENRGAASARNTGIYCAKGEYIAFLDGDDIWLPNKLQSQIEFIKGNNLEMTYCDALMFGEKPWSGKRFMETSPSEGKVTLKSLLSFECNFITSGTICRKDKIIDSDGFDECKESARVEDFELWVRLLNNGISVDFQKEVLLKYRVFLESLSGGSIQRAKRTIAAMQRVSEVNHFSDAELNIINIGIEKAQAQLELEKAKLCLVESDFEMAQFHLRTANNFYQMKKYQILIWFLRFRPDWVLKMFQYIRSDEFAFISTSNIKKK